ncbi:carbohydrate ABC transporter permease [Sanguibacter sp. Z1732]|uniref:carbohydrate ABC transporter permease n=1 Tax=Sanguibacter sp. Z1732 TaxID=3435412 RepID=UPI003D9CB123
MTSDLLPGTARNQPTDPITRKAPRRNGGTRWYSRRQSKARLTLAYIGLLGVGAVTIFPFAWMVLTSLNESSAALEFPPQISTEMFAQPLWENFRTVLFEHNFTRYLANSMFVGTMTGIGQVLTCTMAGFAFARMRFRGSNVVFGILLATMLFPPEVTIIPEFVLVSELGWLDTYLPLIVPSVLVGTFGTFMMREFFMNIPDELVEAATVDGAKPWRIYWSIFLPLSAPAVTTLFLVAFINNWNELLRPVLYISSRELRPVTVGLTTLQSEFGTQWNLLMAGAVLSILPMLILFIFFQRYIVQGIATTGLK